MMIPRASQSTVPVGTIIADKYRVERLVGKGGMGMVVAARHIKLDEQVAIKLMLSDDLFTNEAVERFLREAKAGVRLKHNEHVARVTDVDTLPNGLPYMVMELLHGHDLDKRLKERGVFPIHEACLYVVQACRALVDAHKLGIIHRDLKPQNLFLTQRPDDSPCIKVLDFGISKHTLADESASIDLTRPSDILGSAYYMSPEQARSSRTVVPQSDIYSLGAVLYKVLTGRAPFPKQSALEVYEALLNDEPEPPSRIRTDIPPALEAIILRCLSKRVDERIGSAHELMAVLGPFVVPSRSIKVDESDCATTLPRVRPANLSHLRGTLPLGQVSQAPVREAMGSSNDLAAQMTTQPLDAKSLHAALHGYLPPRTPQPPTTQSGDQGADGPTPRIAPRAIAPLVAAKPAPILDEPRRPNLIPPTPSVLVNAAIISTSKAASTPMQAGPMKETIYAASLADVMSTSALPVRKTPSSQSQDALMVPWNSFPTMHPAASKKHSRYYLFAGSIVAILVTLLALKLLP